MGRVKQTGVLIILSLLCTIFVATSSTSNVSAFTMSVTSSEDASIDILPDKDSDTSTNISVDDVNVVTICRAGYNLTMSTSVNNNNLYLNGDSTNNTTGTYFTPVNGTSPLNTSTNSWGYFFSNVARSQTPTIPTKTSIFSPVPTSNATPATLKTTTQTASSADINDTLQVYLGVTMNNSITPGSYKMIPESNQSGAENGSLIYYLTMDGSCNTVNIAYDGNNADAGTMGAAGTGVIHTNVKDGDNISLIASNFSRTGYGFAGWSFDKDAGTKLLDNDNTNNPVVYGPQETITVPVNIMSYDTDSDGIVKLYAVWLQSQGDLQGWMGCANLDTATYDSTTGKLDLTKNSVTALTDQRDHDTYAVARLADGKCWMIENLRLDNQYTTGAENEAKAQAYAKYSGTGTNYGDFIGLADSENTLNWANSTTANSLYYSGTQSGTASINIGTSNGPTFRFPRYNNQNTATPAANITSNDANIYSYGNWYTWAAAIADTSYYYNSGTHNTTSICPTGWSIPIGAQTTASKSFGALSVALGGPANGAVATTSSTPTGAVMSGKFRSYPNNFLYSGYFNSGLPYSRGSYGHYWSSTVYSNAGSHHLALVSNVTVNPGTTSSPKSNGYSIRCIASDPETYTLAYDANGGSGAPGSQSIAANGLATFTISNTTPTRSGYTFAGWSDENSNEVQPGGTYRTKDTNAVLYAIWTNNSCNPTATTIGTGNTTTDAKCLQDIKPSMKAALPTADATTGTYTLIDARDGQSYTIAKLADGNLWLTKNLNYGSTSDTLLTSHDTDLPSDKTFKAPASTTSFETTNSSTTYVSPKILTNSTYGGYYSYAAAIASTDAYTSSNQNITTSICPKGWDLPTSTMYNNLRTTSGNTSYAEMSAAPYSFRYAGYRNGTSFSGQTNSLRLWTSTNYSDRYAYYTTAYSTATYSSNYKRYGESVRCVASNGAGTIHYNANGGSGTMADQTGDISLMTVSANSFTPANDHKQFREWCTNADGTGTCVVSGASASSTGLTDGSSITLYAQWDDVWVITFVNTATNATRTKNIVQGKSGTVAPTSSWTRTNYKLAGWDTVTNDGSTGTVVYTNGQSITPTSDMTVYTVWTPSYKITYDGNGATGSSTMSGVTHTGVGAGDKITLYASNFSRTGYGFAGWSFDPNAQPGGSSTIYGPMETITAPAYTDTPSSTASMTLYAVWVQSAGSIQSWTGCSSMNTDDVTALTDQRDNDTYAVAKLADGNCWMIENLRLADQTTSGTPITLNSSNTNSPISTFTQLGASMNPTSTAWCETSDAACNDQSMLFSGNTTNPVANMSSGDANIYSYGNYYNWYSATAGNGTYSKSSGATDGDICPTGWHLPYGGALTGTKGGNTSGGFYYLGKALGATASSAASSKIWRGYPQNFVYSGSVYGDFIGSRGSGCSYWSSTASNRGIAYGFYFNNSYVTPGTYSSGGKYAGGMARCVADNYSGKITYDRNANDVEGAMDNQEVASDATSVTLWASNYNRSGYGFAGWNTKADGTGTNYGPNQDIDDAQTLSTIQASGLKLYANWVASAGNIQDWTGCSAMNIGDVTALTDQRDNQTYAVAKLADDKCWMIENLRLESTNSDNSTGALARGYAAGFSGLATAESSNFSNVTTSNSLYSTSNITGANQSSRFPRYNNSNTQSRAAKSNGNDDQIYSYGNYYTWAAAVADTSDLATDHEAITDTSICPAGWTLPTGGDDRRANSDYRKLSESVVGVAPNYEWILYASKYEDRDGGTQGTNASKALRSYPNNFVYSGNYSGESIGSRGTNGLYWTSSTFVSNASNTYAAHAFGISSSDVYPGNGSNSRFMGRAVRCVSDNMTLYDTVADRAKGTLAEHSVGLTDTITANNSGIFTYDAATFGTSSDRYRKRGEKNTSYPIYFYRGVLDTTMGTYGSDGDGARWTNYVKLNNNTCWRIVRTTSGGGVKLIYNGTYGATTSGSCANATTNAQIGASPFSSTDNAVWHSIVGVGYMRNDQYAKATATSPIAVNELFGRGDSLRQNQTDSDIKDYIDSWFANSMQSYTNTSSVDYLERSSGYCGDRTLYDPSGNRVSESTKIVPYIYTNTSGARYYFGARMRNYTSQNPTYGCEYVEDNYSQYADDPDVADGYTPAYEMGYPVALITADEATLAGSGSGSGATYSVNSFLNTGGDQWTLSPWYNALYGHASVAYIRADSTMSNHTSNNAFGVRPVVTLVHDMYVISGSGTATDPWVVNLKQ